MAKTTKKDIDAVSNKKITGISQVFESLDELIKFTSDQPFWSWMGRFQDASGFLAHGKGTWHRGVCILQNAYGSQHGVSGMLLCVEQSQLYCYRINGNGTTEPLEVAEHEVAYKSMLTWENLENKPKTFPPSTHNHDDRYLTESEIKDNYVNASTPKLKGNMTIPYNRRIGWGSNAGGAGIHSSGAQHLYLRGSDEGDYALHLGVHDDMWALDPDVNDRLVLGTSNHRWRQVYSTSPEIVTSDKNQKHDINPISDQYVDFFFRLLPVSYKYNDGASGRTHIGYISQDVEAAMAEVGLTDLDFAGFCRDQKTVQVPRTIMVKAVNENGEECEESITYLEDVPIDGEYVYSLRYEEFIALNTAVIQSLLKRVQALEELTSGKTKFVSQRN